MRNDGTAFALQTARPSLGSNDHVKWRSRLQLETLKYSDFVTNSHGESWDSSCERSWVPVQNHRKNFFRPFGPQFGLRIRGTAPSLDPPLLIISGFSSMMMIWCKYVLKWIKLVFQTMVRFHLAGKPVSCSDFLADELRLFSAGTEGSTIEIERMKKFAKVRWFIFYSIFFCNFCEPCGKRFVKALHIACLP